MLGMSRGNSAMPGEPKSGEDWRWRKEGSRNEAALEHSRSQVERLAGQRNQAGWAESNLDWQVHPRRTHGVTPSAFHGPSPQTLGCALTALAARCPTGKKSVPKGQRLRLSPYRKSNFSWIQHRVQQNYKF